MKYHEISRPIGLNNPCKEIEITCSKAPLYKRSGIRPNHYIIPLDSGCGRTTLIEYMVDMYKKAGVLSFNSGLDDHIEITFDGTPQQIARVYAAIDSAAVYTNRYSNIIAMDISNIAAHLDEVQYTEFMKLCKNVCKHACVVFFVHAVPNKNEETLIENLRKSVPKIKRLEVNPYTKDDMCALIVKTIKGYGFEVEYKPIFCAVLAELVSKFDITSVKNAIAAAETIVGFADFSSFVPVVDENSLKSMIASWHNETERSEVK